MVPFRFFRSLVTQSGTDLSSATAARSLKKGLFRDPARTEISSPGDINMDGILDVLDVVQVVQCILGEQVENCEIGDVNGDSIVDVLDVVQLVNIILGS